MNRMAKITKSNLQAPVKEIAAEPDCEAAAGSENVCGDFRCGSFWIFMAPGFFTDGGG
jgi:hypothetical protein